DTQNAPANTWVSFKQDFMLASTPGSGHQISMSWASWASRVDNYNGLWVRFYDKSGMKVGESYKQWSQTDTDNSWTKRKKWEGIDVPETAVKLTVWFQAREGTLAYLSQPMLVLGSTIGDYVPGNYNNNARVAELEVSLDGITGLVKDPNNGLSATATLAANGMTVATNAQSAASTAIQKADGIQTTVESMQSINLFNNSDFNPDIEGWGTSSNDNKHNFYRSFSTNEFNGVAVGIDTTSADTSNGAYFATFRQEVNLYGTPQSGKYISMSWRSWTRSKTDGMYQHIWINFYDSNHNDIITGNDRPMNNWDDKSGSKKWLLQKWEGISVPDNAKTVRISFEAREGVSAYLSQPMIVLGKTIGDVYVSGSYNNNSSMQSIRTQLADQITDEVEDRKTGDKSTVTQLTGVINQKVIDITQGYTSLNTQTSQLFETKIKNVADQVNSMGQSNLLINSEFNPDLEGWYTEGTNGIRKPYRSYTQGNINATVVGWETSAGTDSSYARLRQQVQLASTPLSGQYISMSWYANARTTAFYNNLWLEFQDSNGVKISTVYVNWADLNGHSPSGQNSWNVQNKWEGIAVPDGATQLNVSFEAREGTNAYLGHPMLVLGATIGSYTPGPYNNNNLVESTRTQLAGMIQDKVDDVGGQIKSLSTQTAGQFTTEIQDRKNGDTNTLSQSKSYTTSQIASAKSGLESEISQSADGIMASVSQVNRLFNTQFTPDLQGWNVANNGANGKNYNFYRSYVVDGETTVGINVPTDAGNDTTKWYSYFEQDVAVPGNNGNTVFSLSWDVRTITNTNYTSLWFSFLDSNHKNVNSDLNVLKYWNGTDDGTWYSKKVENISVPTDAKYIRVSFQCREGTNAYLKRPMLTFTKAAQPYMPGSYMATDTVLQLFKDNWAIGIQDNSGKLITGINGDTSNTRIVGKQITLDGNVSVTGDFYALGGNFKNLNASNITVGTLNGANLNIINLDAGSISTGTLNGAKANITNINASNINTGNFNASLITTGQLNAKVLTGDTGHLGTTDTGRIINKQDNHLQLAAKSMYNNSTNRAQLELLANTSDVDDSMKGTLNYYSNPTNSGHGLGIRFKANQILAIDEDGGSKNLYLSPYSGGQVRIVSRDLSTYYDIAAAHFNVSSQRKFKTNITDLEDNALDIVNNTKIHRYTKNGQTEIGVIADETDERLLTDDKKFVSIYDYTSVLYKAVQELSAEIEALKNERSNSQQPSD
ncbi:gp58-like family protein, partial [Weissella paramesenteroides]